LSVEELPAALGRVVNGVLVAGDEVIERRSKDSWVRSYDAMAPNRSGPLGERPKTAWKACRYSPTAAIWATAASRFGWPISTELTIGNAACSSSVFTRPSQNCVLLYSAFRMVGALRCPTRAWIPIEVGFPSVNARAGS